MLRVRQKCDLRVNSCEAGDNYNKVTGLPKKQIIKQHVSTT